MLPIRFFRDRAFSAANGASLFMYFGMFGTVYESAASFTDGLVVATWVGAAVVGVGALAALFIPPKRRAAEHDGVGEFVAQPEAV